MFDSKKKIKTILIHYYCWYTKRNFRTNRTMRKESDSKTLTLDTINEGWLNMKFSLKSKVALRAEHYNKEIKSGKGKNLPFNAILRASIGDLQSGGQPPLTYLRQLLALCVYPNLCDSDNFPKDVQNRAESILSNCLNKSIGSRTDPRGIPLIREHICEFIGERDGVKSDDEDIIMANGSTLSRLFFKLISTDKKSKPIGIMIPVPTYPIYPGVLSQHHIQPIPYYLSEEKNWGLDVPELHKTIEKQREKCYPLGFVIINPGNPTGQVFDRTNMEEIIKFCYEEQLFIFADEVYQQSIIDENTEFHSFRKVKYELGPPYCDIELVSIHSASKGVTRECGLRGSYMELDCIDEKFKWTLTNMATNMFKCPNTCGQIAVDVSVHPPKPNEESYPLFCHEKNIFSQELAKKAKIIFEGLNSIDGIRANKVQGGLFAYATIALPEKAILEAKKNNVEPSIMWCLGLLDETGVAVVPGCSFLQKDGGYHFRVALTPPIDTLHKIITRIKEYHQQFLNQYN